MRPHRMPPSSSVTHRMYSGCSGALPDMLPVWGSSTVDHLRSYDDEPALGAEVAAGPDREHVLVAMDGPVGGGIRGESRTPGSGAVDKISWSRVGPGVDTAGRLARVAAGRH